MPVILIQFCLTPLIVFSCGWSFAILAGVWARKCFVPYSGEWKDAVIKNSEKTATNIVLIGIVFLSMLFLGIQLWTWTRWALMVLWLFVTLFQFVKFSAGADFGSKKLPKDQRALLWPLLLPSLTAFLCGCFGCWWMFQVFRVIGL